MGAARRQVAEGGAGAGESVVEVQARYNCSCLRVQALPSARMYGGSSACAECVAARNECSGGGQPVPAACGCAPPPAGGGQNPRNATWSLSGNFVRMIFPLLIMPILRPVGISVLPFHGSVL